jgi:signal transduction histidine kinase
MRKKFQQHLINPQFKALRWRLLGAYLLVMLAIQSISYVLIYEFFIYNLYQQVDYRLSGLAQAAAHHLVAIKKDSSEIENINHRVLDEDGDLDIPWQYLREPFQSVEWFDAHQHRLGIAGRLLPNLKLTEGFHTLASQNIRTFTIAVYGKNQLQLEGYIRVSESIKPLKTVLRHLYWGFGLGGIIALGLITIGGMWLTNQSFLPIEKGYQQLKQFTTDASHELRSPLTIIKTSVEVMQTHPERIHPDDELKFGAIVSATNQMSYLVENLLLLARTEKIPKQIPQTWILIPLDELLEDVIEFLELKAQAKQIVIQQNWQANVVVRGDATELYRVFANLLDNALRYTPSKGTVKISLHKNDKLALVKVEDTGIGIATKNLSLVFERFWRSEAARFSHEEGSGLGLAIALAIVKKHGGDITVSSVVGVGSCFTVRLPLVS